jgi:hypothetical protein
MNYENNVQNLLTPENMGEVYTILTSDERVQKIKEKLLGGFRDELQENIVDTAINGLEQMAGGEELSPEIKENKTKTFEYAAGIISFIIYTQYYTEKAREFLLSLKTMNGGKYTALSDFLLKLVDSGIPAFLKSYVNVIQLSILNPISNIMKLGLHILKQVLLKTGLHNENLIDAIDTGLDTILLPLMMNPATRAALVGIGVGIAPIVAGRNWAQKRKDELNLISKYLTEKQSSGEHEGFIMLRELEGLSLPEKVNKSLPYLKSALMVMGNEREQEKIEDNIEQNNEIIQENNNEVNNTVNNDNEEGINE